MTKLKVDGIKLLYFKGALSNFVIWPYFCLLYCITMWSVWSISSMNVSLSIIFMSFKSKYVDDFHSEWVNSTECLTRVESICKVAEHT